MATPSWITQSNLGVYSETYNFTVAPVSALFTAAASASVAQINGALPLGLSWTRSGNSVVISGESVDIVAPTLAQITWRVTDPNDTVADRTFYITIVPVRDPPSWLGQTQDLGYASSGTTSSYTVNAHSLLGPVSYLLPTVTPPTGLSINSRTGVITYTTPVITADTTTAFTVRATAGGLYSDLAFTISVLTVPHAPAWVTDSGLIAEILEDGFVETPLVAYESSSNATISYQLVSSSPAFPFTLTSTGLVYGYPPQLFTTTVYQFTVNASSANGSTARTFDIIVSPATVGALLYWTSKPDLGTVQDGQYTTLDCSAYSSRHPIQYNLVGGILPRGMVLEQQSGFVVGFMEFQTRDRSYTFDISASDGIQTIQRGFTVTVTRRIDYQYLGVTIPVEGSLKDIYYDYVGSVINPRWVPNNSSTPQSILYTPYVQLIDGLNYAIDNPAAAVNFANLHLNTTELMIGAVTNVNTSPSTTLFYSPILDANSGAAASYAQANDTVIAGTATSSITTGPVTFITDTRATETSIVPGTTMRASIPLHSDIWLQGSVTNYAGYNLTIDVTMTSGAGTYSNWDIKFSPTYPPSLVNMRNDLISGLGWVNDGQGSGAMLSAYVDPITSALSGILIESQGSGYLYSPSIVISGSGNGAVAGANISVVGTSIHYPGSGWVVGQEITLDPPAISPAVVTVSAVDSGGGITALDITDSGEYALWPAGLTTLTNGVGLPARVTFSMGIGNTYVIAGGSGYVVGSTYVTAGGTETLPSWQASWFPYLQIGNVFTTDGGRVVGQETASVNDQMYYQRWPLQHAILEMQGVNWTGDTTFDQQSTAFDGSSTFFTEWLEPIDTVFDTNMEIFNQGNTRFDDNYAAWQAMANLAWGRTPFDQETTIFDIYNTTFDSSATPTRSVTLLRRLLRVVTQQISGHDVVV